MRSKRPRSPCRHPSASLRWLVPSRSGRESAQRLNADADVLEKAIAGLRKPLAELIEAVDGASHPEVAHEPGPMIFATQVSNLWQALTGPDGANFASAIRQLGERIKNGEADYRLRQTIAEEAASLRKVG